MDVEDHLARFRPVAPPPGLREKVLAACDARQRSRWRAWPFVAAAAALLLLALANIAIEARLSAAMPPSLPGPSRLSLEEPGASRLPRLLVVPARAEPAAPQSLLRLRLELGRSPS